MKKHILLEQLWNQSKELRHNCYQWCCQRRNTFLIQHSRQRRLHWWWLPSCWWGCYSKSSARGQSKGCDRGIMTKWYETSTSITKLIAVNSTSNISSIRNKNRRLERKRLPHNSNSTTLSGSRVVSESASVDGNRSSDGTKSTRPLDGSSRLRGMIVLKEAVSEDGGLHPLQNVDCSSCSSHTVSEFDVLCVKVNFQVVHQH